jgi:microcystin-dependent protein
MAAQTLSVYFSVTNGANATLNVDGLGAFPIVTDGTFAAVPAGTLIAGSFYDLAFSNANSVWILKNFYQLPYTVPVGGLIDFIGTTSPNSNFILPYGQAISRVTYANLFSLISTTFGAGDGSTTFNVPDLRGRMLVGKDDMGGSAAGRVTTAGGGLDGATLGATGGAQNTTLITANLPAYTPAGTIGAITVTSTVADILRNPSGVNTNAGSTFPVGSTPGQAITSTAAAGSTSFTGTPQGGTSTAFSRLPPALIVNKLLRVI